MASAEDKNIVDLCAESPGAERKQRRKRRREQHRGSRYASSEGAIQLSDDDDDDVTAPWRRKYEKPSAQTLADERLARRLQEEEQLAAAAQPPLPSFAMNGSSSGVLSHDLAGALRSRWDWLDQQLGHGQGIQRSGGEPAFGDRDTFGPGGGSGLGGAVGMPGMHGWPPAPAGRHAVAMGPLMAGLLGGGAAGPGFPASHNAAWRRHGGAERGGRERQLAHLSLMDRDFGEQDYEMLLQLDAVDDQEKKRMRSANVKALDALPYKRVSKAEAKEKEEVSCAVCLEGMRANQTVVELKCKHTYHRACILKWLKSCEAPSCPQCKAPVLEPNGKARSEPGTTMPVVSTSTASPQASPEQREPSPEQQWWHT